MRSLERPGYARRTLGAYRTYAASAIENWERSARASQFLRQFAKALFDGAKVLDYGCGIGTDMLWLKNRGLLLEGIDGNPVFVKEAKRRLPGVSIWCAGFEEAALAPAHYDGIWCNAALMHVPPATLAEQLRSLRRALRPQGVLGITLAWGRRKGYTERDWIPGRYIAAYSKQEVIRLLGQWKVQTLRVRSGDGRNGRWIQVLAS